MTAFCEDCPDHEACASGYPCEIVKTAGQAAFCTTDSGKISDEPDRGVSAPQPGSDRPTRITEQRG